jgi:hypothetical protein
MRSSCLCKGEQKNRKPKPSEGFSPSVLRNDEPTVGDVSVVVLCCCVAFWAVAMFLFQFSHGVDEAICAATRFPDHRGARDNPLRNENPLHNTTISMDSLAHIACLPEYRELSNVEKGLKLMKNEDCSIREAAAAVGIGAQQLWRAKIAQQENRDIGKKGRPRILNVKEEGELVSAIVKADIAGKPLTYKRLREVV